MVWVLQTNTVPKHIVEFSCIELSWVRTRFWYHLWLDFFARVAFLATEDWSSWLFNDNATNQLCARMSNKYCDLWSNDLIVSVKFLFYIFDNELGIYTGNRFDWYCRAKRRILNIIIILLVIDGILYYY